MGFYMKIFYEDIMEILSSIFSSIYFLLGLRFLHINIMYGVIE